MGEVDFKESQKNISDKFLDVIFSSIDKLQYYQRNMLNGCQDLYEYIQQFNLGSTAVNYIKVKNMNFMLDEFDILFQNTKEIIDATKFKLMEKKLKNIRMIIHGEFKDDKGKKLYPFKEVIDQVHKRRTMFLYPLFSIVQNELSSLRGELINNLSYMLYSTKQNKKVAKQF